MAANNTPRVYFKLTRNTEAQFNFPIHCVFQRCTYLKNVIGDSNYTYVDELNMIANRVYGLFDFKLNFVKKSRMSSLQNIWVLRG